MEGTPPTGFLFQWTVDTHSIGSSETKTDKADSEDQSSRGVKLRAHKVSRSGQNVNMTEQYLSQGVEETSNFMREDFQTPSLLFEDIQHMLYFLHLTMGNIIYPQQLQLHCALAQNT
jgi:hypothetical protein